MSVRIMGLVWDCELERDLKYVLLAYADHADHTGRSVYPSDDLVAWKTGYSSRQVTRLRLVLIEKKILLRDGKSPFGTNAYRIDPDALPQRDAYESPKRGRPAVQPETPEKEPEILPESEKQGDTMSPIYEKSSDTVSPILEKEVTPCHPASDILDKSVTFQPKIGDIAMSVNPSLTINNKPSILTIGDSQKKIEGSRYSPQDAWEAAMGQLQLEMPKAAFETWVRDAKVHCFQDGKFYIVAGNAYARDWLQSRLRSTVTRMLIGICNQDLGVHFVTESDLANMPQTAECAMLEVAR